MGPWLIAAALLLPSAALARGHPRRSHHKSRSHHASASQVAGALRDADRPAPPSQAQPADELPRHGPRTIDFDERQVEGQTNKSGAVYLYDRKDLQVKSMVKQPNTFRSEIAKGLLD